MSIEFYNISEGRFRSPVFSITEKEYNDIKVVFEEFQKRTSIYIDPYGSTRIYKTHIKLLIELLRSYKTKQIQVLSIEEIKCLDRIINLFMNTSDDLIAEGD